MNGSFSKWVSPPAAIGTVSWMVQSRVWLPKGQIMDPGRLHRWRSRERDEGFKAIKYTRKCRIKFRGSMIRAVTFGTRQWFVTEVCARNLGAGREEARARQFIGRIQQCGRAVMRIVVRSEWGQEVGAGAMI